jgi:hypothetical protein
MRNSKEIARLLGVAIVLPIIIAFSVSVIAQSERMTGEQFKDDLRKTEQNAIQLALNDPKIRKYVQTALYVGTEYEPMSEPGMGIVRILTWGKEKVTGDWKIGYSLSLTDGRAIEAYIDNVAGKVVRVKDDPRLDSSVLLSFDEEQKKVITIALTDSEVQKLIRGRDYYVSQVHSHVSYDASSGINCPEKFCYLVVIRITNTKMSILAAVNTELSEVVRVAKEE